MEEELRFTVVVPTRDRPHSLARCLAAVERQDADGPFEIIVVDDGSVEVDAVAAVAGKSQRTRLVRSEPSGSVAARNRGARDARAPVVLFVDDDCEPRPDWARLLMARLDDDTSAAAGRCVNADSSDTLGEATQVVLDCLTLHSIDGSGWTLFAPTYNLACRRDLVLDFPFDARYVNAGADRDWCARLVRDGRRIALEPRALVDHRQLLDLRRFWRKHRNYGRGSARFHSRNAVGLERPGFYAGLLRDGFRKGPRVGFAVCLAQLATSVGYLGVAVTKRAARSSSLGPTFEQRLPRRSVVEAETDADGRRDVGDAQPPARHARL